MSSFDLPSFLIGIFIPVLVYILYVVLSQKTYKPLEFHFARTRGSRKEDKGVVVELRAKREQHNDGKPRFRGMKWDERNGK